MRFSHTPDVLVPGTAGSMGSLSAKAADAPTSAAAARRTLIKRVMRDLPCCVSTCCSRVVELLSGRRARARPVSGLLCDEGADVRDDVRYCLVWQRVLPGRHV